MYRARTQNTEQKKTRPVVVKFYYKDRQKTRNTYRQKRKGFRQPESGAQEIVFEEDENADSDNNHYEFRKDIHFSEDFSLKVLRKTLLEESVVRGQGRQSQV